MKNLTPLEQTEQSDFVTWLENKGLKFTSIPNNTYTKYHSVKRHNHTQGLRRGFPDLVILIAPHQSKDGLGYFIAIEMKRIKDGVLSIHQEQWISALNSLSTNQINAYVAKGSEEAKTIIKHYLYESIDDDKDF